VSADVLDSIVDATRRRIREGAYAPAKRTGPAPDGARFVSSLREPGARIIAEIKAKSPSAGELLKNCDGKVESIALAYRRGHAAAISIVSEREFFGGDPSWAGRAKRISGLPALMKDFVLEESQLDFAASYGADAVLLIASILGEERLRHLREAAEERGMASLVEAHSREEIGAVLASGAEIVGVNTRDLRTFDVKLDDAIALASAIPERCVRVAESGIQTRGDVEKLAAAGYRAFLVGEALLRSEEPEVTLRELRGKS
jgi:indole-3-glycerol phosphate synthase